MIKIGICLSVIACYRVITTKNYLYLPIAIGILVFLLLGLNANLDLATTMLANQEQLSGIIATRVTNDAILWLCISALLLTVINRFEYFYLVIMSFLLIPCLYNYDYINGLFNLCCGVMCVFSIFTKLSYLESCTLINIYGQLLIVFIGTLPLLYNIIKKFNVFVFIHIALTWFCIYRLITPFITLPLKKAAQLCVKLLYDYSINVTYNELNIFIFVICFIGNLVISRILYKICYSSKDKTLLPPLPWQ